MDHTVWIKGTVVREPVVHGSFTTFELQTADLPYQIIRMDPKWQIKDAIFLCKGQRVEVLGIPADAANTVQAQRILITGYSKKENKKREW